MKRLPTRYIILWAYNRRISIKREIPFPTPHGTSKKYVRSNTWINNCWHYFNIRMCVIFEYLFVPDRIQSINVENLFVLQYSIKYVIEQLIRRCRSALVSLVPRVPLWYYFITFMNDNDDVDKKNVFNQCFIIHFRCFARIEQHLARSQRGIS